MEFKKHGSGWTTYQVSGAAISQWAMFDRPSPSRSAIHQVFMDQSPPEKTVDGATR